MTEPINERETLGSSVKAWDPPLFSKTKSSKWCYKLQPPVSAGQVNPWDSVKAPILFSQCKAFGSSCVVLVSLMTSFLSQSFHLLFFWPRHTLPIFLTLCIEFFFWILTVNLPRAWNSNLPKPEFYSGLKFPLLNYFAHFFLIQSHSKNQDMDKMAISINVLVFLVSVSYPFHSAYSILGFLYSENFPQFPHRLAPKELVSKD